MGRRSEVLTTQCGECGTDVDVRYRHSHKHKHKCHREDVEWDEHPDPTWSSEFIAWCGTCDVCGRRVYECYTAQPALYDNATNAKV